MGHSAFGSVNETGIGLGDRFCDPSSNEASCDPSSNEGVCDPSSNEGVCGPSSNEGVCGPSSNEGVCGPSSNEGVCGPSSNEGLYDHAGMRACVTLAAKRACMTPVAICSRLTVGNYFNATLVLTLSHQRQEEVGKWQISSKIRGRTTELDRHIIDGNAAHQP